MQIYPDPLHVPFALGDDEFRWVYEEFIRLDVKYPQVRYHAVGTDGTVEKKTPPSCLQAPGDEYDLWRALSPAVMDQSAAGPTLASRDGLLWEGSFFLCFRPSTLSEARSITLEDCRFHVRRAAEDFELTVDRLKSRPGLREFLIEDQHIEFPVAGAFLAWACQSLAGTGDIRTRSVGGCSYFSFTRGVFGVAAAAMRAELRNTPFEVTVGPLKVVSPPTYAVSATKVPLGTDNGHGSRSRRRRDKNGRMLDEIQHNPESLGWSLRKWAKVLKCGKTTVSELPAWKTIVLARSRNMLDRADADKRKQSTGESVRMEDM